MNTVLWHSARTMRTLQLRHHMELGELGQRGTCTCGEHADVGIREKVSIMHAAAFFEQDILLFDSLYIHMLIQTCTCSVIQFEMDT